MARLLGLFLNLVLGLFLNLVLGLLLKLLLTYPRSGRSILCSAENGSEMGAV